MGSRYQAIKQGGPFEIVQVPKPTPGPNEVVIKVKAVALCPLDWKQLLMGVYVAKWPVVLGSDGAGVVDAVGEEVEEFKKGDEVVGYFARGTDEGAAFQEYPVLEQRRVAHKPGSWSFEDASTLMLNYVTTASVIYNDLGISLPFLEGGRQEPSKLSSILVVGGSSSTGASAIQLLRLALGPQATILTTSSSKHHSHLKSLGATACIDHSSSSVVEDIKTASGGSGSGAGVEAIFDVVNGVAQNPALLQTLTGPKIFAELMTGRNIAKEDVPEGVDHKLVMGTNIVGAPGGQSLAQALGGLLKEGKFKLPVPATVVGTGWDAIGAGIEKLHKGVSGTKLVVTL